MARPSLSRASQVSAFPARVPSRGLAGRQIGGGEVFALVCVLVAVSGLAFSAGYGAVAVLPFLVAAAAHFLWRFEASVAAVLRHWPLLLLPLWALASVLWADYPAAALRASVQLCLTMVLCIALLATAPARIALAVMSLVMALTVTSILLSDTTATISATGEVARVGFFGSKNNASLVAAETVFVALMLLAVAGPRSPVSLAAIGVMALGLAALFATRSLGTIIATLACIGLAAALHLGARSFASATTRMVLLVLVLLGAGLALLWLVSTTSYAEYDGFMRALGKDPTLTNRTNIWAVGLESIARHFTLGVGYYSFWQVDNPEAVLLWRMTHREIGVPLGFHNTFIHIWVELGVVGALLAAGVIAALVVRIWVLAVAGMTRLEVAASALALMFVLKSFVETLGFQPFSLHTFFLCLAWVALFRRRLRAPAVPRMRG